MVLMSGMFFNLYLVVLVVEVSYKFRTKTVFIPIPTGYKTLRSANLPLTHSHQSTRPQKHFETVTYSGTGSTNKIESLELQPDLFG